MGHVTHDVTSVMIKLLALLLLCSCHLHSFSPIVEAVEEDSSSTNNSNDNANTLLSTNNDLRPFDVGTRILGEYEEGSFYWGEVVSVFHDVNYQRLNDDTRSGGDAIGEYEYKVAWSDEDYTRHSHEEIAEVLNDQSKWVPKQGRRFHSTIEKFNEPAAVDDKTVSPDNGRRTCKRIRMAKTQKEDDNNTNNNDIVTPEELYIKYVSKSTPVIIEGFWKDHIDDPTFRMNWTLPGMTERWRESLNLMVDEDNLATVFYSDDNAFQRIRRYSGEGYRHVFPHSEEMNFDHFANLFEEQERKIKNLIKERRQNETAEGQSRRQFLEEYVALRAFELYDRNQGGYTEFGRFVAESIPPHPLTGLLDVNEMKLINVWVQGRDKISKLHTDREDNFLGVLSGTKTVYLVDPAKHMENLYTGYFPKWTNIRNDTTGRYRVENTDSVIQNFSPVDDVLDPDLDRFPKFQNVIDRNDLIRCDLAPGDLLFIPTSWWHEVHNDVPAGSYDESLGTEGANVAINFWFDPNPILLQLYLNLRQHVEWDWVNNGKELDKEFESRAAKLRAERQDSEARSEPTYTTEIL